MSGVGWGGLGCERREKERKIEKIIPTYTPDKKAGTSRWNRLLWKTKYDPEGDFSVAVKCVFEVKCIFAKCVFQNKLRMTLAQSISQ